MSVEASAADRSGWEQFQRRALIVGVVGLAVCVGGALLPDGRTAFFRAYLLAHLFWLGIALGCLVLLMVQHLTGGGWGRAIRRVLEAASRTLPLLAVLFVPLFWGMADLYVWARPDAVAADQELQRKSDFLNVTAFWLRAAVYFAVWLILTFFLNRWSREQDESPDPGLGRRFRLLSGPGLALYGLTITFASIDWVMSLEPHWSSTIYGALFGAGQVLSALAFALAVLLLLMARPPLAEVVEPSHLRDLGSLLLAFVMLWAYLSFSQYLLIWAGNLQEEIPWYLARLEGGWQAVGLLLVMFHFGLPFLLLLSRDIKRNRRTLATTALIVLGMRYVDLYWLIVPAFHPEGISVHWLEPVALVGVGGIWLAVFLTQLGRRPLVPAPAEPAEEGGAHG